MALRPQHLPRAERRPNTFLQDVIEGLSRPQKSIPPKYFYDREGSRLFDEITALPEYYLTRAEIALLTDCIGQLADVCRGRRALVEFGSGSARKARMVLEACPWFDVYAPCDISGDFLEGEAAELRRAQPHLEVMPVVGDFTAPFSLPGQVPVPRAGLFLGSTIGNFDLPEARQVLAQFGRALGRDGVLIVGVDLVKDVAVLERAYDDARGVTARFNLNVLGRINRELGGDFQLDRFAHRALFDAERSRIEMHLVSVRPQTVHVGGHAFVFAAGETIHTESSYKYTVESFRRLAWSSGWTALANWVYGTGTFSLHALGIRQA